MSIRPSLTALIALSVTAFPLAAQGGGGGGQFTPPTPGKDRVWVVPGLRDGPSAFPLANYDAVKPKVAGQMDFQHYHTSEEIEWWMRKWAAEHPNLVELYQVGESFGGRHSGEITSTESVLYLMWHLITNYGKDASITALLDEKAIYLRPLNNPDGSDLYRLTAQANRSSVRPMDNDGDGLMDEDPSEDLDGDGFVTSIRKFVGAGKGSFVIDSMDPKGRLMRGVGQGNGDYIVQQEGFDNDGDGRINEDGIGGLDLHRNYPYNWRPEPGGDLTGRGNTQGGAGEYPLSEPETRSMVLFTLSHPNIGVVNSMDTSVPMHLRGPSTCEETECMYKSDLALYKHMDSVGISITNYPWAGDVYRTYATRGGNGNPQSLYGHGPDWGYFQFGAIWYGDELWNGGRERDYNTDGRIDQYEVLRYCDEEYAGKCFLGWNTYNHPELGEVEIGGMNPKFWSQNGPPEWVEKWAKNQAMFNLYMAQSLPKLEIVGAQAVALRSQRDSATHEVRVTIRNHGRLPTALEQAKQVKIVRPDQLVARPGAGTRILAQAAPFWIGGNETKVITLRVVAGSTEAARKMALRLTSTRGGIVEREVTF